MIVVAGVLSASTVWAQEELYHVRMVKAAPGSLGALIQAELKAPPDPQNSEPPIYFRHVQGDDWHLLVLQPLGKDETLRAEPTPPAVESWLVELRKLSARHSDSFVQGPPWSQVKKALLGDGQPGGVYVISAFEPVPGHREDLAKLLGGTSSVVLQHREGAAWSLLSITRHASWAAFGEAMGQQTGTPPTAAHIAAHHDTVAIRVTAPQ